MHGTVPAEKIVPLTRALTQGAAFNAPARGRPTTCSAARGGSGERQLRTDGTPARHSRAPTRPPCSWLLAAAVAFVVRLCRKGKAAPLSLSLVFSAVSASAAAAAAAFPWDPRLTL